jgi:small-conductance mechanosensitive channel
MGLFSRRDPDNSEARIARLETHLTSLQNYLEEVATSSEDSALAAPGAKDRRDETQPAGPPRIIDADMVEQTLAHLTERIDQMAAGLTQVETRLSSISTEITNQLSELGNEIDALATRLSDQGNAIGGDLGEEILTDLKAAQARLAQEQARYQIAFRQDLADLAERIKPPL